MPQKLILIIDDDNRNIFALKAVLKAKGFDCLSAISAQDGFSILEKHDNVAIVLMDMMMPDMDGYQAIAAMKNRIKCGIYPYWRSLPRPWLAIKNVASAAKCIGLCFKTDKC